MNATSISAITSCSKWKRSPANDSLISSTLDSLPHPAVSHAVGEKKKKNGGRKVHLSTVVNNTSSPP